MKINQAIIILVFALLSMTPFQAIGKDSATTIKVSEMPFSLELPSNMKEVNKKVDKDFYLYQYAASGENTSSNTIIKMMAVRMESDDKANDELWQTEALVSSLTHLVKEYHLSMKNVDNADKALGCKGEKVILGPNTFQGLNVTFGSTQAQFLNIIKGNVLYIFTLVSIDPDERVRKENLQRLIDQMKTIQFLGIRQQN